jgi:phosphoglycolate phosphatase-like HAD superfamily hydrolase
MQPEYEHYTNVLTEFLNKHKIYYVGWDVDGTLVNTTAIYEQAMDKASSQILFGLPLSRLGNNQILKVEQLRENMRAVINGTREEFGTHPRVMAWAVNITARSQGVLPGSERYLKARQEIYKIHNGQYPEPYPGTIETLWAFDQTGVSQFIATHAERDWTMKKLRSAGISPGMFDHIICMDVTKPKEEQWQESLMPKDKHRYIDPKHLLFIGDNPNADIRGTKRLGAKCVFINKHGNKYPEFEADSNIWMVNHISQIPQTLKAYARIF